MTSSQEPLAHLLARLPAAPPDCQRGARVQARCQSVLKRGASRRRSRPTRRADSLLIVALSVAYLLAVIQRALH